MGVMGDKKLNSRKPKKDKPQRQFQDFEFVEMRLSADEKAQFLAYVASSNDELWDDLNTLIQAGYKLSVSYLDQGDCFIASLTCKGDADPNNGYVLSSRSDILTEAILLGVYKTTVLCPDNVWPKERQTTNWG